VGTGKDKGTLKGIAKLVYGDSNSWIQIFEANRSVLAKPGEIPFGTSIWIPRQKREVPKLISRVAPVYPEAARKDGISGDVVMDVALRDDGSVAEASVIEGDPLLAEAATSAVKQWRYRPLVVQRQPVVKFVVVVSFSKKGRVQ